MAQKYIAPDARQNINQGGPPSPEWQRYLNGIQALEKLMGQGGTLEALLTYYAGSGAGDPNTVVTAPVGSFYTRTDGGAGTSIYIKESGTGNTGWVAK
jgi:hypothetical protein